MNIKSLFQVLLTGSVLAFSNSLTMAGETEAAQLEGKIQKFYQQMNEGNFADAFQFIQPGASGYLPTGMLIQIPNEEVLQKITQRATAEREAGKSKLHYPKHFSIRLLGTDHALASYYVDGSVTTAETKEKVLRRLSLVLNKTDGVWKIIHWHASSLEQADEPLAGS